MNWGAIVYFLLWAGAFAVMMRSGCGARVLGYGDSHSPVSGSARAEHAVHGQHGLPVVAFGLSLSLFLAISFGLCVLGYLWFPGLPVAHAALSLFLPGFQLLSWPSFFLGLVESFAWGWYIALIFGPLYNFFVARRQ